MEHILRLPINLLPVSLKAREKPQKNHLKSGSKVSEEKNGWRWAYFERNDGQGHHAEVDHRQCVFPPQQTRIEETDTYGEVKE